jgi:hypothetical protein
MNLTKQELFLTAANVGFEFLTDRGGYEDS